MKIALDQTYSKMRLDIALSKLMNITRAKSQKLINDQLVLVNDKFGKNNLILDGSEEIVVQEDNKEKTKLPTADIVLNIVYEDEDVLIINKPSGLVVHPGAGHHDDTLVNALSSYQLPGDQNRPGIVHRLDKDTSGLLVVAKTEKALADISQQFHDRLVVREYIGLVKGELGVDSGQIKGKIGRNFKDRQKMAITSKGKEAFTNFQVLERFSGYSLVKFSLITGRTHQIRVHMDALNFPLVGDGKYGDTSLFNKGQLLHCYHLKFISPTTKKEVEVSVDLPDYFNEILTSLRGK